MTNHLNSKGASAEMRWIKRLFFYSPPFVKRTASYVLRHRIDLMLEHSIESQNLRNIWSWERRIFWCEELGLIDLRKYNKILHLCCNCDTMGL